VLAQAVPAAQVRSVIPPIGPLWQRRTTCSVPELQSCGLTLPDSALFADIIKDNNDGRGCLLANCAAELALQEPGAVKHVREGFDAIARVFASSARAAQARGELDTAVDPQVLVQSLVAFISGLRVVAKSGMDRRALTLAARDTLDLLVPSSPYFFCRFFCTDRFITHQHSAVHHQSEKAMTQIAQLTLTGKTIENANPGAKAALEGARKSLGFVPNMYANMANSPGVLETYLKGYDLFRKESGFTPAEQEVVFLTISRFNGCTYCMAAHSMIGEKVSKVPPSSLKALREGTPLPDAKLQALSAFTRTMVDSRGKPTPAQVREFLAAGYSERQVLEIILALAVKSLSNYSNHVFNTKVDPAFSSYRWGEDLAA
jgi:uncharacterized peroxidase-related enzyme